MGGEKFYVDEVLPGDTGSPPHGRGKGHCTCFTDGRIGITPAWAGKRGWMRATEITRKDHPRMGGEKNESAPLVGDM